MTETARPQSGEPAPGATTGTAPGNVDAAEIEKFSAIASEWWDAGGKFRPLHDINPLRLALIEQQAGGLRGKRAIDVGCGGGLVAEGMAQLGAAVTGIDLADKSLAVAKLHALDSGVTVDYRRSAAEAAALDMPAHFDVVTCLEMLEHVPDPASVITACATLAKPGATVIFSTLSRTARAYATAIIGAEYLLRLLPRGTHDHARFLKPSELVGFARAAGLLPVELRGLDYNPFTRQARWTHDTHVNYVAVLRKP